MTVLATYAEMANKVYEVPNWSRAKVNGWETWTWGEGQENTTGGFHGCIYKSASGDECVVACRGTAAGRDFTADVALAVGWCPRQTTAAWDLYNRCKDIFAGATITLVGHSLGGGLCQVIGHWSKARFVTFNAPPMKGTIEKTKLNFIMQPQKAWRAIKGTFGGSAVGINYRLTGDAVSSRFTSTLGHYGRVETLFHPSATGPLTAHSMDNFQDFLRRSSWGQVDPFA